MFKNLSTRQIIFTSIAFVTMTGMIVVNRAAWAQNDQIGISTKEAAVSRLGASGDSAGIFEVYNAYKKEDSIGVRMSAPEIYEPAGKILSADGEDGDEFGTCVAIDGETAIVGARWDDIGTATRQGSVYIFARNGTGWILQQKLIAPDGLAGDAFGSSLALDGDTLVIGAETDDNGPSVQNQGSVYVYVRNGTTWTLQQKIMAADGAQSFIFGHRVAISGNTILVSSPSDTLGTQLVRGSVYVFVRNGSTWNQQQKLFRTDGSTNDDFGFSPVALNGDTALVGASYRNIGSGLHQGAAYVYARGGTTWTQTQLLTASDLHDFDEFGYSISMSGDNVMIGARGRGPFGTGAVYFFNRTGSTLAERQIITALDFEAVEFGNSVALSGDQMIVGARQTSPNISQQGAAYIFVYSGSQWLRGPRLVAADGQRDDLFGQSVAVLGSTALVGVPFADIGTVFNQGSVYVFRSSSPTPTPTPSGTPLTGFTITPTFDSSITSNSNSAAIQDTVNRAILMYQSQFSDPVNVSILFRYSNTRPDGMPLPSGNVGLAYSPLYRIAWNNFRNALVSDSRTATDSSAVASLPNSPLSLNVTPSSACGRALGLNTPGVMTATGSTTGGSFDGIVTLNSDYPYQFTRPTAFNNYDALRTVEHEIDHVLGLQSFVGTNDPDLNPQDILTWASPNVRGLSTNGSRYFSVNSGVMNIRDYNQSLGSDRGDWLSQSCPQANPFVQNAALCPGQSADVSPTSPEGFALDSIGYDPRSSGGTPTPTPTSTPTRTPTSTPTNTPTNTPTATPTPTPSGKRLFDYDGDRKADLSVYRPSNGLWFVDRSRDGGFVTQLGGSTDKIAPADFDNDGKTDVAVYRPSQGGWYVMRSSTGVVDVTVFGAAVDLPVPGDYDGDGKADVAVYRPTDGTWYVAKSSGGTSITQFGASGDVPAPGDYDGDGKNDLVVWRPSNGVWFERKSTQGDLAIQFGASADKIAPADYDGDGKTDVGIYRPSQGTWYSVNSLNGGYPVTVFGVANDIPVPADYDGDGRADVGVFRPSDRTWYLNRTTSGLSITQFGAAGDKPTPNAFGN